MKYSKAQPLKMEQTSVNRYYLSDGTYEEDKRIAIESEAIIRYPKEYDKFLEGMYLSSFACYLFRYHNNLFKEIYEVFEELESEV